MILLHGVPKFRSDELLLPGSDGHPRVADVLETRVVGLPGGGSDNSLSRIPALGVLAPVAGITFAAKSVELNDGPLVLFSGLDVLPSLVGGLGIVLAVSNGVEGNIGGVLDTSLEVAPTTKLVVLGVIFGLSQGENSR